MKATAKYKEIEDLSKQYYKLSKNIINYEKYIAYSLTHHSTAIEGSTLTESQVVNLLEFGKTATSKPYEHHLMVSDFYKAFLFMNYYSKSNNEINPNFIQELGGLVVKSTSGLVSTIGGDFDVSKGDFRLCSVRAGSRYFPDYKKVPKLISDFIKDTNSELKKVKTFQQKMELAFKVHFHFVSIHPFGDGNGRTSRLLMNYIQHQFKIPYTFVLKEDRLKYYAALEKARKEENLQPFYDFMFAQHLKLIKREIKNTLGAK
jgi:Fic family protein